MSKMGPRTKKEAKNWAKQEKAKTKALGKAFKKEEVKS